MLLAMLAVRHKTRRKKFMAGIPLIIAAQVALAALPFNQSLSVSRYSVTTDKIIGTLTFALVTDITAHKNKQGQNGKE